MTPQWLPQRVDAAQNAVLKWARACSRRDLRHGIFAVAANFASRFHPHVPNHYVLLMDYLSSKGGNAKQEGDIRN
jgi:hypothetical protein